jgi:hypothetical protein
MTSHPTTDDIARLLAWARHLSDHRATATTDERAAFQAAKHDLLTRLATDPPAKDQR